MRRIHKSHMKLQTIINAETTPPAPANYLARLAALESDRDSARSELDRAMMALHRWQNRIDALASEVEKLDIELSIERSNLAFQLRQERNAKYPAIQSVKPVSLALVEQI